LIVGEAPAALLQERLENAWRRGTEDQEDEEDEHGERFDSV